MVSEFEDLFISKRMLKVLFQMIDSGSETIKDFFASAIYKSPLMQNTIELYNLGENFEEYIFPSYTSLINPTVVNEAMQIKTD